MIATIIVALVVLAIAGIVIEALRASHRAEINMIEGRHRADRYEAQKANEAEYQRLCAAHAAEVARLVALYEHVAKLVGASAQDAIRLVTTGHATVQPVEIAEREVDAHTRVSRMVTEQTIDRGMAALREEYRKLGLQIDDDLLREEVTTILSLGMTPPYPAEPQQNGVPEAAR